MLQPAIHSQDVPVNYGARMSTTFKPTLTEEERAYCRALALALEPFRDLRATMPLQYVYAFLLVAMDEGEGSTEYAKRAGVSPTVMTRHLLDMGDSNRELEPGFGLITQSISKADLRRKEAKVTPEGKAVVRKIMNAMRTIPKDREPT